MIEILQVMGITAGGGCILLMRYIVGIKSYKEVSSKSFDNSNYQKRFPA